MWKGGWTIKFPDSKFWQKIEGKDKNAGVYSTEVHVVISFLYKLLHILSLVGVKAIWCTYSK